MWGYLRLRNWAPSVTQKIFWHEIFIDKNLIDQNFFWDQKFFLIKSLFLGKNYFQTKNCFWRKKISGPKVFVRTKNFFGPKFFFYQNFFWPKFFLTKFFLATMLFLCPKCFFRSKMFFEPKVFLDQTFFFVPRRYGAWTYVSGKVLPRAYSINCSIGNKHFSISQYHLHLFVRIVSNWRNSLACILGNKGFAEDLPALSRDPIKLAQGNLRRFITFSKLEKMAPTSKQWQKMLREPNFHVS